MSSIVCPLMTAGQEVPINCLEDGCAWYYKSFKTCSMYLVAHSCALDVKKKQEDAKHQQ